VALRTAASLPARIYFSAAGAMCCFFGRKRNGEHGGGGMGMDVLWARWVMQNFVNACWMVHPGAFCFDK